MNTSSAEADAAVFVTHRHPMYNGGKDDEPRSEGEHVAG